MENLEQFVDEVLKEKGLEESDLEVVAQIKSDLMDRVENRVNAMILENLPEDELSNFEKVLDKGNEEEIQSFVKTHIPDINEKVAVELLNFRLSYVG